jgi:acetyl esterase/lipase
MLGADHVNALRGATILPDAVTVEAGLPDAVAIVTAVRQPVLLEYRPGRPNGRAMLVIGGGGYVALMAGREGVQVARWLNGLGYTAFVLIHRLPDATCGPMAPLDDAEAGMRTIRAAGFTSVGVVGLSSGGHLAACLAAARPTSWPGETTAMPDAMVIGYAPISTNAQGRTLVADKPQLAPAEKQTLYDALQPDTQLRVGPPPAFIVYAANDTVVPVDNAWRLHAAWLAAGGAAELHVFADAPHGFALDTPDLPVSTWPALCEAWLRQVDFL